ncbi:MAG: VOC family protein [Actinomycetes bacterium]
MALARWMQLCLDASDAAVAGAFWAGVLSLQVEPQPGGGAVLRSDGPGRSVWVNRVPEPKVVKNRVHLDLVRSTFEPLLDAGAEVRREAAYDRYRWTVLADPEGNEFCVFDGRNDDPTALVVDSADPVGLAAWWAGVLDARQVTAPGGDRRWLADVPGLPWDVVKFVGVNDPRTVKNRVHWDVVSGDVDALVVRGARVLRKADGAVRWHVLADPEGNEFCVFAP